ncbi:MAG: hypothetical protein ABI679_14300 [Gemmatimonadota bacterium]
MRKLLVALMFGGMATACGGGGDNGGNPNPSPNVIEKTASNSGEAQVGTVGSVLANPFCVRVSKDGASVVDAPVTWATVGGSMSPTSAPSTFDGSSCSTLTLSQTSGAYTASASLTGASGTPVVFHATANPGAPTQLQEAGGDGATAQINTSLPVTARVADQFGNGIGNFAVAFAVTSGNATVAPATIGTTPGTGNAAATVTLGATPGAITVSATSTGLTGSPLTFHITSIVPPPPPTAITINVNNPGSFSPSVDTVAAGGTVTWTWTGTLTQHSVTSTGPTSFVSDPAGITSGPHSYGPITFNTPGTYFYYCEVHGSPGNPPAGMSGRIVVQ